ncbi:hypothetical protein CUMW_248790 [Citrus unshiu]|uniref:Uncharacterized protein n=1 Tax=Citrus unshiu TaxID=55188 RepID=A0A2H5QP93_CITUN|nr:hypothetical protein CUMW_248790 [Citrus unshiu]
MSKSKEKVIDIDDKELDFLPSLLADPAFDPGIILKPIRSSVGTSARRMSPQITSSTSISGDEGSSGSEDTLSEDQGEDSGEMSSPGTSRPDKKSKVEGSWGVHYQLKSEPLKRVEAVLANSCSNRELTTYNLFESRLMCTDLKMEDSVIEALNQKRPRPHAAKRDPNKDAPTANEFSRLVSKKNLEDFDGSTLGELVGAMQYNAFYLGCMATYYKAKVGRYDRKMRKDIQSAKTKADSAEKKAGDLNLENLKLIERESLVQARAITLEEELTKVKEDLQRQKATYEAQLESLKDFHQTQHPDLKMDELAAGVTQYMDEEATKEDIEELEPNATEEGASLPRAVPADVADASTPPGATGVTPCS